MSCFLREGDDVPVEVEVGDTAPSGSTDSRGSPPAASGSSA